MLKVQSLAFWQGCLGLGLPLAQPSFCHYHHYSSQMTDNSYQKSPNWAWHLVKQRRFYLLDDRVRHGKLSPLPSFDLFTHVCERKALFISHGSHVNGRDVS